MTNLGGFSEEALALYHLSASEQSYEFSEGDTYDFARCVRPDGSFYGTGGTCRKGSLAGAKEKAEPKTEGGRKRRATAEAKAAGAAARKAAGAAKRSDSARRVRLFQEELKKSAGQMRNADDATRNRLLQEASDRANKRHAAGEDVKTSSAKAGGRRPKAAIEADTRAIIQKMKGAKGIEAAKLRAQLQEAKAQLRKQIGRAHV